MVSLRFRIKAFCLLIVNVQSLKRPQFFQATNYINAILNPRVYRRVGAAV